jgi:hypothetical protein
VCRQVYRIDDALRESVVDEGGSLQEVSNHSINSHT